MYPKCNILGFSIEFKYMIVLINEIQTMFSFSITINFNITIYLNLIEKLPNVMWT